MTPQTTCEMCEGKGEVPNGITHTGPGMAHALTFSPCPDCHGHTQPTRRDGETWEERYEARHFAFMEIRGHGDIGDLTRGGLTIHKADDRPLRDFIRTEIAAAERRGAQRVVTALEMTSCCDDGGPNGSCDCQNINIDAARDASDSLTQDTERL